MPHYQAYRILSIVAFPALGMVCFATVISSAASYWQGRRIVDALYATSKVFAGLAFLARFQAENTLPSYSAAYGIVEMILWAVYVAAMVIINVEKWVSMYRESVNHARLAEIERSIENK